ncbi:MAG: cytochrome c3 family protein [Oligoflexales bacterium]|nr:cytochrome c3 family protein [Oligoflexales bacterium]
MAITLIFYNYYYEWMLGPKQPISFSHLVHAGNKKVSCFFCHSDAKDHERASLPPIQTCMLCHSNIIITHPEVKKVREHFFEKKPVLWEKVTDIPDFVFFNHAAHIGRAVDCSVCHGNINKMDRIVMKENITMGFCVTCHKKNNISHDCLICHR